MTDFSPEEIRSAVDDARRNDIWDFMFQDPGSGRTSRRTTNVQLTSRRRTSRIRNTSGIRTSRRVTSRRTCRTRHGSPSRWVTKTSGRKQVKRCWQEGNMWEYRRRRR